MRLEIYQDLQRCINYTKITRSATAETVEGVLSAGAYAPEVVGIVGQTANNKQLQQRQAIIGTD